MEPLEPCHSDASNISSTKHETMPHIVLDPNLSTDDLTGKSICPKSKLELNLFNSSDASKYSNKGNPNPNPKSSNSKTFKCNFCNKEFSTLQALGGHQNAHKQERALSKHKHKVVEADGVPMLYGHPYSYPAYNQVRLYGPSLGVRTESMIHKPYSYHTQLSSSFPFAYHYDRENMSRSYLTRPPTRPPNDGLRIEKFLSSPKTSDNVGLGFDKLAATLPFVLLNPNPNSASNAATTKGSEEGNNQGPGVTIIDDDNDPSVAQELDLDLKL